MTGKPPDRGATARSGRLSLALDFHGGRAALRVIGLLRRLRPRIRPSCPVTIGICALGAVGDAVLSSAMIADLKRSFPGARVVMVVSNTNAGVVPLLPECDGGIVLPLFSPVRAIAMLRQERFDLLIDANQWLRISALYTALSGARYTVGFRTQSQYRHYGFDVSVEHSATRHELENYRALLAALDVVGTAQPAICLPRESSALPVSPPYAVLHPWAGGSNAARKEWPEENWIGLARALTERGFSVVVSGALGDKPKAESLVGAADQLGVNIVSLAGQFSLAGTARLLSDAALVVSVNTGVMHIAAALGVGLVALHGPTNPARWGPVSRRAISIVPGPLPPGVPTCYLNLGFEFPSSAPDCMRFIPLERVLDAVDHLTDPPTAAARVISPVRAA